MPEGGGFTGRCQTDLASTAQGNYPINFIKAARSVSLMDENFAIVKKDEGRR
jgi:hypothetical protein